MCHKALLATVIAFILLSSTACTRHAPDIDPRSNELFSMAERLEKLRPWTLQGIEKITGRTLKRISITDFESDEEPDSRFLRNVELTIDPREELCITGISLCLPRQGFVISRAQVIGKYGKCDDQTRRRTYDEDALKRFGYFTLIGYDYKRRDGGWWRFDFDDDKSQQLRILGMSRKYSQPVPVQQTDNFRECIP